MAVLQHTFKLFKKRQLTHDVFELVFTSDTAAVPKPGQYILFHLPSGLKRAYSIAYHQGDMFTFVVKRKPYEWSGSRELCDIQEGTLLQAMGPIGHFTLSDWDIPRMFIGTGTWFAPLYFQVRALEARGFTQKTLFAFWVRKSEDIFHTEEFQRLMSEYPQFSYIQYLSQDTLEGAKTGYVTELLLPEIVSQYQEFYICGSPALVKSARETLESLGISKESIRFEQY